VLLADNNGVPVVYPCGVCRCKRRPCWQWATCASGPRTAASSSPAPQLWRTSSCWPAGATPKLNLNPTPRPLPLPTPTPRPLPPAPSSAPASATATAAGTGAEEGAGAGEEAGTGAGAGAGAGASTGGPKSSAPADILAAASASVDSDPVNITGLEIPTVFSPARRPPASSLCSVRPKCTPRPYCHFHCTVLYCTGPK